MSKEDKNFKYLHLSTLINETDTFGNKILKTNENAAAEVVLQKVINKDAEVYIYIDEYYHKAIDIDDRLKKNKNNEKEYNKIIEEKKKLRNELSKVVFYGLFMADNGLALTNNINFYKPWGNRVAHKIKFPDICIGGGKLYLEATCGTSQPPKQRRPYGIFISCIGFPNILKAVWTDCMGKEITGNVALESHLLLHIYTQHLYGQELDVTLYDHDIISGNDELSTRDKTGYDHVKQLYTKSCEVNVYECKTDIDKEHAQTDYIDVVSEEKKEKNVLQVQKAIMHVYVGYQWLSDGGDKLDVFPLIKINQKEYVGGSKAYNYQPLKVRFNDKEAIKYEENADAISAIKVGRVDTNIALFHPCKYRQIYIESDSTMNALDADPIVNKIVAYDSYVGLNKSRIQIIAGNDIKKILIKFGELHTQDCSNKGRKHTPSNIVTSIMQTTKNGNMYEVNVERSAEQSAFNVTYPIDTNNLYDIADSIFSPRPEIYSINTETCGIQNKINLEVFPDIEFVVNIKFNAEVPLYIEKSDYYHMLDKKDMEPKSILTELMAKKHKREGKYQNNTIDLPSEKDNAGKSKTDIFSIDVSAEYFYNGKKVGEFNVEKAKKIYNFIKLISFFLSMMSSYTFRKDVYEMNQKKEEQKKRAKARKKCFKGKGKSSSSLMPIEVKWDMPSFSGGVGCRYVISANDNAQVVPEYRAIFKASPLLDIEMRLDLLFAAKTIPFIGTVISVIEGLFEAANVAGRVAKWAGLGNLEISWYIDLVVKTNIPLAINAFLYNGIDGFKKGDIQMDGSAEFGVEAGGGIEYEFLDMKGRTEISMEAKAKFKLYYGKDNANSGTDGSDRPYTTFVEFEGVFAEFVFDSDNKERDEEDYITPEESKKKSKKKSRKKGITGKKGAKGKNNNKKVHKKAEVFHGFKYAFDMRDF